MYISIHPSIYLYIHSIYREYTYHNHNEPLFAVVEAPLGRDAPQYIYIYNIYL